MKFKALKSEKLFISENVPEWKFIMINSWFQKKNPIFYELLKFEFFLEDKTLQPAVLYDLYYHAASYLYIKLVLSRIFLI